MTKRAAKETGVRQKKPKEKGENVLGMWAMHLGPDKTFSKRMGREYREGEGLGNKSLTYSEGLGRDREKP